MDAIPTYSQIRSASTSPLSRPKMDAKTFRSQTISSIISTLSDDAGDTVGQMALP
jgi:hypothetical protein